MRTTKSCMIRKNAKPFNTRPEQLFNKYQESRNMHLIQNVKIPVMHEGKRFTFQLDFVKRENGRLIDFEIDGKGHKSKWDRWKDELKVKNNIKVIHIDALLTQKKFWNYLDEKLKEALTSRERVIYVYG